MPPLGCCPLFPFLSDMFSPPLDIPLLFLLVASLRSYHFTSSLFLISFPLSSHLCDLRQSTTKRRTTVSEDEERGSDAVRISSLFLFLAFLRLLILSVMIMLFLCPFLFSVAYDVLSMSATRLFFLVVLFLYLLFLSLTRSLISSSFCSLRIREDKTSCQSDCSVAWPCALFFLPCRPPTTEAFILLFRVPPPSVWFCVRLLFASSIRAWIMIDFFSGLRLIWFHLPSFFLRIRRLAWDHLSNFGSLLSLFPSDSLLSTRKEEKYLEGSFSPSPFSFSH